MLLECQQIPGRNLVSGARWIRLDSPSSVESQSREAAGSPGHDVVNELGDINFLMMYLWSALNLTLLFIFFGSEVQNVSKIDSDRSINAICCGPSLSGSIETL